MPNKVALSLRLEDVIALGFFLAYLAVLLIFRDAHAGMLNPADVEVIAPAVLLLFGKEIVHSLVSGKSSAWEAGGHWGGFIRPYWEILRDWSPFFVILLMYYSLWGNATHLLVTRDRDPMLIAWDQKLFGCQPSVALQTIVTPGLTAWMEFAYFFHILNIPIVACFIYLRRPRLRFREMMCGAVVVTFAGLVGYVLVPAIGPIYTLAGQFTVPLSQPYEVFSRETAFMDFARIQRDCFPSLHVGLSFVVWLYAWRNSKRLFWILAPFVLSLWFSTVYLRYHYLVDVVAGFCLAPLCYAFSNWMFKRFGELKIAVPVPAWAGGARGVAANKRSQSGGRP
jgi:membrane-associated phospholipid phosphatase